MCLVVCRMRDSRPGQTPKPALNIGSMTSWSGPKFGFPKTASLRTDSWSLGVVENTERGHTNLRGDVRTA
jgi:hypothetical protein